MPATKAQIVNWALAEIGLAPKFSIDEQTQLGAQVDIFWPRVEARLFGLHDWTDLRKTREMTRKEAAPDTGYAHAFLLPGDRIGAPKKLLSDPRRETPLRDYRIEAGEVHTDEKRAWATCTVALAPEAWPPQFADIFAVALSSQLAIPLLQDMELSVEKEFKAFGSRQEGGAGGMVGRLIAQDRAGHPLGSPLLREDPLTRVR